MRLLALMLASLTSGAALADDSASGELRLRWDARDANAASLAPASPSSASLEAELRGTWHAPVKALSASANVLLGAEHPEGGATRSLTRANELYGSADFGSWQMSAGKKIVGWDVGYGFRPNDFVQQEERRTLLTVTPEGRPLLQLEHFGAEDAASLLWVNPQRTQDDADAQRGARESALAARWYRRSGALDGYLFGRWGQHTHASLGAALAWVAGEELELHASTRALQRHDGWAMRSGALVASANPWQQATLGGTTQWLLGASWTGQRQQSLLVEFWHDGTAQATPFLSTSLRRDNLFVRAAWQPEHWLLSLDALVTPADRGHAITAAVQWQGDRLKLNAALRVYGGPADALMSRLPQRRVGVIAATWAF